MSQELAHSAIKGLSAQPVLLLVAVLNVLMLGALLYVGKSQVDERRMIAQQGQDIVKEMLERCKP
jgi:hypothetical protein